MDGGNWIQQEKPGGLPGFLKGGWIVENRNSADYMELGGIVKGRRRQEFPLYDLKTRPYSLRVYLFIGEKRRSHTGALNQDKHHLAASPFLATLMEKEMP
jgi:hypothetical protein